MHFIGKFDESRLAPPPKFQNHSEGYTIAPLIDHTNGTLSPHDLTFEESYFVLSGEIEGVLDGEPYLAKAGDVLWTGVGCVHSFKNKSDAPVRWNETFSPQPPAENQFRFMAEWEKRAVEIEG